MKWGLCIVVPDDDRKFVLSGMRVANMWTYGFAREFKTAVEARSFGEKAYGAHWNPTSVPLVVAQSLVRDVCELYSGKKTIERMSGGSGGRFVLAKGHELRPGIDRIQELLRRGDGDLPKQHRVH